MLAKSAIDAHAIDAARKRLTDAPPDLALLAFEGMFSHRQRGKEAKDGALKHIRNEAERLSTDPAATFDGDVEALLEAGFAELAERFG